MQLYKRRKSSLGGREVSKVKIKRINEKREKEEGWSELGVERESGKEKNRIAIKRKRRVKSRC
jgi:hypothetical protein